MKLYHELADWWHLLSAPEDYAEEAELFWSIISNYKSDIKTALELGSGGGNNAYHLKKRCSFTLTDLSPAMINMSRKINPNCQHYVGDMRNILLHQKFDLVFIHDAIMHMTSEDDLLQVFKVAKQHLKAEGFLFIVPDFFKETFQPSTQHGGSDDGGRGLRYLEWTYDPDPSDQLVATDYAYILRNHDGSTQCIHDHSVEGIFSKSVWEKLLRSAGFMVSFEPIPHSEFAEGTYLGIAAQPI